MEERFGEAVWKTIREYIEKEQHKKSWEIDPLQNLTELFGREKLHHTMKLLGCIRRNLTQSKMRTNFFSAQAADLETLKEIWDYAMDRIEGVARTKNESAENKIIKFVKK